MMRVSAFLIMILALNAFLYLTQVSLNDMAQRAQTDQTTIFNYNGSIMYQFGGESQKLNTSNYQNELPDLSNGEVQSTNNDFFTNIINTFKNWLTTPLKGLKVLTGLFTAFPSFMELSGFNPSIVFAASFMWYALITFLIVEWLRGIV